MRAHPASQHSAIPNQLFANKVGVVMGVANKFSIATGIADVLINSGAELAFSYLPDNADKMEGRVKKALAPLQPKVMAPCDVLNDESLNKFFATIKQNYGKIDFLVHSIAYAPLEDLKKRTLDASRDGFLNTMDCSVYSFIACAQRASKLMNSGGAIVTLSYYGAEKVIPGYNVMGLAKSALESAVRYASYELGPEHIRVNGISAGPLKTLSSSALGVSKIIRHATATTPLKTPLTQTQVGEATAFLLSDLSRAITGEILHVDNGYHAMGLSILSPS